MDKKNSIPSQTPAWYPRPHDINFTFKCRFLSSRIKSIPLVVRVQILGKTLPFQWENCLWRFVLRQFHPGTSQSEYNKKNKETNAMPKTHSVRELLLLLQWNSVKFQYDLSTFAVTLTKFL